jgi:hypothetical protein
MLYARLRIIGAYAHVLMDMMVIQISDVMLWDVEVIVNVILVKLVSMEIVLIHA